MNISRELTDALEHIIVAKNTAVTDISKCINALMDIQFKCVSAKEMSQFLLIITELQRIGVGLNDSLTGATEVVSKGIKEMNEAATSNKD